MPTMTSIFRLPPAAGFSSGAAAGGEAAGLTGGAAAFAGAGLAGASLV